MNLEVSFGPSASLHLSRALAFAKDHCGQVRSIGTGVYSVSFALEGEKDYAAAFQLLQMVGSLRATLVIINGSIEQPKITKAMLSCARDWLRSAGRCQAFFRDPKGWPKCRSCPLYSLQWAAESGGRPSPFAFGPSGPITIEIPDYLPDDWDDP